MAMGIPAAALKPRRFIQAGPGVRDWRKGGASIATANRWTCKPHDHDRERIRTLARQPRATETTAR
jgi:hypothetical protein